MFCSDCAPHRVPERLRAMAGKSLLPLPMAEGLAKLTGDFYRQSRLLLRADATAIEGDGRFTAELGLDGVHWLDRYGRVSSGRTAVPPAVPALLGQAVMRYPALAAGVAGKLQVRSAQRFASLAGPARPVDGERLQRLGIRRTNDPTADRILDVVAGQIEAGNPKAQEVDSLINVLGSVYSPQAAQVQTARTKAMPRPGQPVDDVGAALRALRFDSTLGDLQFLFLNNKIMAYKSRMDLAPEARDVAKRVMGGGGRNDATDAFRHAYWSFRMAEEFGPEIAKVIGDGHEASGVRLKDFRLTVVRQTPGELLMDLYNNHIGRQLFLEARGTMRVGRPPAEKYVLDALKQGRLQTRPFKIK